MSQRGMLAKTHKISSGEAEFAGREQIRNDRQMFDAGNG